jgi:hypothetical protein
MEAHRAYWNQQQQALRQALGNAVEPECAIRLFLSQHAMLHSAEMAGGGEWSFADEALGGLDDPKWRLIPMGEHSVAWMVWHIARIEDMTMNRLVAEQPQLFHSQGWQERLRAKAADTGNAMNADEIAALSAEIDIPALQAYRLAVGRRTREIVGQLRGTDFKKKVDPGRLAQIWAEGGLVEGARGIGEYWGGLTIAGLLLMPPTRHCFVHLNEAQRLRAKLR